MNVIVRGSPVPRKGQLHSLCPWYSDSDRWTVLTEMSRVKMTQEPVGVTGAVLTLIFDVIAPPEWSDCKHMG